MVLRNGGGTKTGGEEYAKHKSSPFLNRSEEGKPFASCFSYNKSFLGTRPRIFAGTIGRVLTGEPGQKGYLGENI